MKKKKHTSNGKKQREGKMRGWKQKRKKEKEKMEGKRKRKRERKRSQQYSQLRVDHDSATMIRRDTDKSWPE